MTSTVTPAADSVSMSSQNSRRDSGSTPPVGSSRKTIARLVEDRAAERQPLTPAAGEIGGAHALAAVQAGHVEHEPPARFQTIAVEAVDAAEEPDVLIDGQALVEREPLRHVADAALDAFRIAARRRRRRPSPCRSSASAARTACGSSSTCRRRCCRESRRSPLRARRSVSRSTATKSPNRFERSRTAIALIVPSARARRASASRALAIACVRSSSACSTATCASSTSVLVATPAPNRSATTRLASVALRTASVADVNRRPRRGQLGEPLTDLDGQHGVEFGEPLLDRRAKTPRLPPLRFALFLRRTAAS